MPTRTASSKFEERKQRLLEEAAHAAVIDECGELETKLLPWKPSIAKAEKLRKTIRDWYATEAAGKMFHPAGDVYQAIVGVCGNSTVIWDMDSVFEAVGRERFVANAKFSLDVLASLISPALYQAVTRQEQIGPRNMVVQPIRASK